MTVLLRHLAIGLGATVALASTWTGAVSAADDTIQLGAAVSITGKYSTNGKNTKDGYDLAVKVINDKGGLKVGDKAYKLEVVYYDDESTPARAAQLTERLISQDGVDFMLGPYGSGLTVAVAPITEKFKVPMVEANGAARELFTQGYQYIFAVLSTSDYYLRDAIKLAAEQAEAAGKDPSELSVAIAIENDPFSLDVRDGVIEDAEKYGMQVVIDDKLPPELNDMSATLTKVKALKPDVLVVSAHEKGGPLAIRQMQEMRVDVPMLALTHCDSAKLAEQMGEAAEYALCASQWDASLSYEDEYFGSAADYAKLFEETYDYAPPYQAAESSAGVLVYADALQRAGSLEPEAVRDALAATDMMTFYGPVDFDETGKNTKKPMVLYQIQDGQYKVVAPTQWASTKLVHPMPTWEEREGS
ncbi:MAG TPA: amino acid ABC transporter substrate-binding protein [Geminicoccaceae bacterium]|nr:amino acid ABC transporter substrate-binding protein [Geminicoccaceae bacterium]